MNAHTNSSTKSRTWIAKLIATVTTLPLLVACGVQTADETPSGSAGHQGDTDAMHVTCGSDQLFALQHDQCTAMDAKAVADDNGQHCYCMLGFAWNGSECAELSDCACEGADCDKLTQTKQECEQQHASCDDTKPQRFECGSDKLFTLHHDQCASMDAKAVPNDKGQHCRCMLGFAWNGSACEGLADCACEGADCDKLTQTQEECEQQHASCDDTKPQRFECGSDKLFALHHDQCDTMDAKAIGDDNGQHCYCMLGYAWNGSECAELSDCACEGADCDKLTQTKEECEQQHASCEDTNPQRLECGNKQLFAMQHDQCSAMDAKAVGTDDGMHCNCALGFAWNGSTCELLADCACEGADCDKLTLDKEECEKQHASCGQ